MLRLVFLNVLIWLKELVNPDCRFEIYVKNAPYSQLEMSGNGKFVSDMSKLDFVNFLWYVFAMFWTLLLLAEVPGGLEQVRAMFLHAF